MELESKLFYSDSDTKKCEKLSYVLSGMGGSGNLLIVKGFNTAGKYCVYMKCEAGLKSGFKMFDFEGLSVWESENDGELKFISFEEKDNTKKIYKKWEFSAGQLQFTENKNGLLQEREVSYSLAGISPEQRVFDPLSVVAFFHLEKLEPNSQRTFYIFGKQQLLKLKLEAQKHQNGLKVLFKPAGMNSKWEKTLEKAEMYLSEDGFIQEVSVPSPLFLGKIEMKIEKQESVFIKALDEIVNTFQV